jgi:murein DD-endopeptidase MepM/ murein hydrolase activator NlpD
MNNKASDNSASPEVSSEAVSKSAAKEDKPSYAGKRKPDTSQSAQPNAYSGDIIFSLNNQSVQKGDTDELIYRPPSFYKVGFTYWAELDPDSGDPDLYLYEQVNRNPYEIKRSWNSGTTTDYFQFDVNDFSSNAERIDLDVDGYKASQYDFILSRERNATGSPNITMDLPLPAGKSWQLTVEIAGYFYEHCSGSNDPVSSHTGNNYYSLDFDDETKNGGSQSNVDVLAAAGGKVAKVTYNDDNGNYVVIDHDYDGNLSTGYSTRYLHLQNNSIKVTQGQNVGQGDVLGLMGGTPNYDVHLHFGVRYQNSGSPSVNDLQFVEMEGKRLGEFMAGCSNTGDLRYYSSSNY